MSTNISTENRLEVLAFADEVSEVPELLASWAATFAPADAVTLIIHPGRLTPDEVNEQLVAAFGAAGLPVDTPLRIEAFAGPLTEAEEQALARRCAYLLTSADPRPPALDLVAVSPSGLQRLRGMLPDPYAQDFRREPTFQTLDFAGGLFRFRDTLADQSVLKGVFAEEAYYVERYSRFWPGLESYTRPGSGPRPLIIDAGGNIGASAAYFAVRYPHCQIVVLEPEARNFELLTENTRRFSNVRPLHKAISGTGGVLVLSDPGEGAATFRVGRGIARGQILTEVESLTVAEIVAEHPDCVPFLLKVDIEGGESELFDADTTAISAFPVVVVELHERMFPGQGNARSFLSWQLAHDRDFHQNGENSWSFASSLAQA